MRTSDLSSHVCSSDLESEVRKRGTRGRKTWYFQETDIADRCESSRRQAEHQTLQSHRRQPPLPASHPQRRQAMALELRLRQQAEETGLWRLSARLAGR